MAGAKTKNRGNLINAKVIVKLCTKPYCKWTPSKIQDIWLCTFMEGKFISIVGSYYDQIKTLSITKKNIDRILIFQGL